MDGSWSFRFLIAPPHVASMLNPGHFLPPSPIYGLSVAAYPDTTRSTGREDPALNDWIVAPVTLLMSEMWRKHPKVDYFPITPRTQASFIPPLSQTFFKFINKLDVILSFIAFCFMAAWRTWRIWSLGFGSQASLKCETSKVCILVPALTDVCFSFRGSSQISPADSSLFIKYCVCISLYGKSE